ncbi:MAG TPA: hypothetical protein VFO65_14020 [Acidimicrobiales bacterium]|nr:hypothetical protein [Acidimicrobiales bacterium]
MKKLFPIILITVGFAFAVGGGYTVYRGFDARDEVRDELIAQDITTPEDASIPNVRVDDIASARSMAAIIDEHARSSTGGLTYSEMGRFMTPDGDPAGTNNEDEAVVGADGRPVSNPLRNTAFQASALRTSLFSSVMAFEVSTLVIGLGAMLLVLGFAVGGLGVVLAGLVLPKLAHKLHADFPASVNPA